MAEAVDRLEGPEYVLRDENGILVYKELTAAHYAAGSGTTE